MPDRRLGGKKSGEPGEKLYLDKTAGPGSEPGSHWWETSAIPPFQLPLCDHSVEKFSISRVNMNRFLIFPENITRSVMGKQRPSEKGR